MNGASGAVYRWAAQPAKSFDPRKFGGTWADFAGRFINNAKALKDKNQQYYNNKLANAAKSSSGPSKSTLT
jgi:hypothetical protein